MVCLGRSLKFQVRAPEVLWRWRPCCHPVARKYIIRNNTHASIITKPSASWGRIAGLSVWLDVQKKYHVVLKSAHAQMVLIWYSIKPNYEKNYNKQHKGVEGLLLAADCAMQESMDVLLTNNRLTTKDARYEYNERTKTHYYGPHLWKCWVLPTRRSGTQGSFWQSDIASLAPCALLAKSSVWLQNTLILSHKATGFHLYSSWYFY